MTEAEQERAAVVDWLRTEERAWFEIAYRMPFWRKFRIAVQAVKLAKRRGFSPWKVVTKVFFGNAASLAASYGAMAEQIERGDHLTGDTNAQRPE